MRKKSKKIAYLPRYKSYEELIESGNYKKRYLLNKLELEIIISLMIVLAITCAFFFKWLQDTGVLLTLVVAIILMVFIIAHQLFSEQYIVIEKDCIRTVNFFMKTFRIMNHNSLKKAEIKYLTEKKLSRKHIPMSGEYIILVYSYELCRAGDYETLNKSKDVILIYFDPMIYSALTSVLPLPNHQISLQTE